MKKYVTLFLLILFACSKDEKANLDISVSSYEFSAEAHTATLGIVSNGPWNASVSEGWLTLGRTSGEGNTSIPLALDANTGSSARSAIISVSGNGPNREVTLRQAGVVLGVNAREITFDEEGTPFSLEIVSQGTWKLELTEEVPWCTFSLTEGNGDAEVILTPTPYAEREPRGPVEIVLSGGSSRLNLSLFQQMDNRAPEAAGLLAPGHTEEDISILPHFRWASAPDPDGDQVFYEILLSTDRLQWHPIVSGITGTEYRAEERLLRRATYYWQVVSSDEYGGRTESEIGSFRTANLSAPVLTAPANGQLVDDSGRLEWNPPGNSDSEAIRYDIEISTDGNDWQTETTECAVTGYEFMTTGRQRCYWRVIARDDYNGRSESEVGYFEQEVRGYLDGEVALYQESTNPDALYPVELIFTGDGYTAAELRYGGRFDQHTRTAVEGFFSIEPYKTYRDYFRVWIVAAESEESGTTILKDFSWGARLPAMKRNTVYRTVMEGGTSTMISGDNAKVISYALKIPGMTNEKLQTTTIAVTINADIYAGTNHYASTGESISYSGADSYLPYTTIHEAGGHGFARLADEYIKSENGSNSIPEFYIDMFETLRAGDPWSYNGNIVLSNEFNECHWKHYFSLAGYERVKLIEGGYYYQQGVWRPEENSVMRTTGYPYFNAPSREAIVRKIMRVGGLEFNWENFLEKDINTLWPTRSIPELPKDVIHTPPQFFSLKGVSP